MMRGKNLNTFMAIIAAIVLTSCTSKQVLQSRLDESTGLTVVTLPEPLVLARPTRFSAAARDYAYLGPVEINRGGAREHFLWIGLATTLDRERIAEPLPEASTLALIVDGLPMLLPLSEWNPDLEVPPYAGNTPVYLTLAARASADQIRRVAAAGSISVNIVTKSGKTVPYKVWSGERPGWAALAAGGSGNP